MKESLADCIVFLMYTMTAALCGRDVNSLLSSASTALQSQTAVTAYLKSKQLLPFGFALQYMMGEKLYIF